MLRQRQTWLDMCKGGITNPLDKCQMSKGQQTYMLILQKEERTGIVLNRKMMPNRQICQRTAMGV